MKTGKDMPELKKKALYLDNRDLALRIISGGFEKVKKEVGDRLDAIRASKIVFLLREDYGYKDKNIDKDLRELADKKRKTHTGGLVASPINGEERIYKTLKYSRIGLSLKILGKKEEDQTRVVFTDEKITIFRE